MYIKIIRSVPRFTLESTFFVGKAMEYTCENYALHGTKHLTTK